MNIVTETYQGKYIKEIADLILGIQVGEFSIPITLQDQPDLLTINEFYQKGTGNFWIARTEEQVVGTIGLIDIGNNQGVIRKMFVAPEYRGPTYNIAKGLLGKLISWAKEHSLKEILLGTTEQYHAAHRFYEKNGFKEIAANNLPHTFPRMVVDKKFYCLVLDS